MRTLLLLLCLGMYSSSAFAQLYVAKKYVDRVRESKTILGLSGDEAIDEALRTAVDRFYTLSEVVEALPAKEALAKASADPGLTVLYFTTYNASGGRSSFTPNKVDADTTTLRSKPAKAAGKKFGRQLAIVNGEGWNDLLLWTFVAPNAEHQLTPAIVHFAVAALEDFGQVMGEASAKSRRLYPQTVRSRSEELRAKTLYVPDNYLPQGVTPEAAADAYGYDLAVVPYETYTEVVTEGRENAAYCMIARFADLFLHYLVDAQTGEVLYVYKPKQSSAIKSVKAIKHDRPQLTTKMVTKYHRAIAGEEVGSRS